MDEHYLNDDITSASVEQLCSDDEAAAYLHLSNGVILAFHAMVNETGQPTLFVTRVTTDVTKIRRIH